ncbi:MAG: ParB/RepB/Spo0J family partition protein [Neisseriaceae bacterium]|nr:ParB/RepB/Spo0J family partition protein [Neisseriaceae bacterium]MBP6862986.1 ParB/RepB/Spo0J family partition protein [Neisseriaceae bacterium]
MTKPKGLGRGLDALLVSSVEEGAFSDRLTTLAIADIRPGRYQPRVQMDDEALEDLAQSIREQGVIQPVIVRESGLDKYEIIAGERRWRASQLAGLTQIPAVIKTISDETALAMGLIENIQRQNLNPIEEAEGLKRLVDEFGMTHETVAKSVGRSRSSISNSLRLLSLPTEVKDLIFAKQLEMGHARALLSLPVLAQLDLAHKAAKLGWSVREVEKRAQAVLAEKTTPTVAPKKANPDLVILQEQLSQTLGVTVDIKSNQKQKGKMVLHFDNLDEFDGLLQKLGVK